MGPGSDSPTPSTRPPPPPSRRKGSKKVRTGCITCKIRKVKCDEAKPFCMRCTKTGRRCDGYLDAKTMAQRRRRSGGQGTSSAGEPRAPLALFHDWASSDERRAFHFFQHITAPCLSGNLDGSFWRVLVLQICQSEPAVRHAVLAVSSFHEGMVQAAMSPYRNAEDRNSFALYQYNRAISCLLDQMRTVNARPLVPLLTCILFVCIELMQSKDRESLLHLEQGRQILSQLGRKGPSDSPEIDLIKQHLVPMYTRLSLTSLMFGGEPLEIPAPLKTLTEVPMVFETIDEVRNALYDFMDECLRFAKRTRVAKLHDVPPEQMRVFEQEQDRLLRKLAKFNVAFSMYRSTKAHTSPAGSISLIQIHVHTTFIWISTALSRHETAFDDYVDTFSAIIPFATEVISSLSALPMHPEQYTGVGPAIPESSTAETNRFATIFAFEMYIIAPLYFVAAKCRHPIIRRAALDLLRRHPMRRENLWRASVMTAIAERTMRLEEKHLSEDSRSRSRQTSPPELQGLFPNLSILGHEPPVADMPGVAFTAGQGAAPDDMSGWVLFDNFEGTRPAVTSSCSSSVAGSVEMGSIGDMAGHMPIDPTLFLDPIEVSTAPSFSVPSPTASSLDDLALPRTSTPYTGPSAPVNDIPTDLRAGGADASLSQPGISLEPATPVDNSTFILPMSSSPSSQPHTSHYSHSQPHSRSQSRHASRSRGSSSIASGGSPLLHSATTTAEMGRTMTPAAAGSSSLFSQFRQQQQQQHHHHHHHHHHHSYYYHRNHRHQEQQQYLCDGLPMNVGRLSPKTGTRSGDAPYDVPERYRVRESIIGPDKEDGTSWVMLFRKLGGPRAEWDVRTEYVAAT